MKNQILSLMLGAVILTASPAFAMEDENDRIIHTHGNTQSQPELCRMHRMCPWIIPPQFLQPRDEDMSKVIIKQQGHTFAMQKDASYTKEAFTKKLIELHERFTNACYINAQNHSSNRYKGRAVFNYSEEEYARSQLMLKKLSQMIIETEQILSGDGFPKPKGELSEALQEEM